MVRKALMYLWIKLTMAVFGTSSTAGIKMWMSFLLRRKRTYAQMIYIVNEQHRLLEEKRREVREAGWVYDGSNRLSWDWDDMPPPTLKGFAEIMRYAEVNTSFINCMDAIIDEDQSTIALFKDMGVLRRWK